MDKKLIIVSLLFLVVAIFFGFTLAKDKQALKNQSINVSNNIGGENSSGIIFFYGEGCPHCAIVEKFIEENQIKSKVSFDQKEVYNNSQNSEELSQKAKACGIPTDSIGVPFLWDGFKCLVGDEDIINFFNQKSNEK